jgi:hypothetical protein
MRTVAFHGKVWKAAPTLMQAAPNRAEALAKTFCLLHHHHPLLRQFSAASPFLPLVEVVWPSGPPEHEACHGRMRAAYDSQPPSAAISSSSAFDSGLIAVHLRDASSRTRSWRAKVVNYPRISSAPAASPLCEAILVRDGASPRIGRSPSRVRKRAHHTIALATHVVAQR